VRRDSRRRGDVMSPIGKGSRFLVLRGPLRGQEGVAHEMTGAASWPVMFDEGKVFYFDVATLEGPGFKRLADAPAEVDPLFAELAALEAERVKSWDVTTSDDDKRCPSDWCMFVGEQAEVADGVIGMEAENPDDVYRTAMMKAAMLALAAVRSLDRAHKT
jgi:hypothetical protein